MKNIIFKNIAKTNNFFIDYFNKINEFIKIINHKFKNISSFNRYLIFLITLLFLYLFFLSIPSLYDKEPLQTKLNKIINEEYNINLSLSPEIQYNILPKPHFLIKNVKFFSNDNTLPKELGQIKKLKVFISQKNFFKKEIIEINSISLNTANFLIHQSDLIYFIKFFGEKFSHKKLNIKNSKFFYIDDNKNVISIFPISRLKLNYNNKDSKNLLISKGEFFTVPYSLNWNKDFVEKKTSTFLKLKKLNLKIINFTSEKKNDALEIENVIYFRNIEMGSNIILNKNLIEIKSQENSKIKNNKIGYVGKIDLSPFYLNMDLNFERLNFKKNIFDNSLLRNLLLIEPLYDENLNAKFTLKIENLVKSKLFNSSKILVNLENGAINFDNTIFKGDLGNLNLISGNLVNVKDDLIFTGNFVFNISSEDLFYKLFQINKKNRNKIKNVYFDISYNLIKDKIIINNLILEPGKIKAEEELQDILNLFENEKKIHNWIDFKNFVRKVFVNYYEG
tara:strand:+ start:1111 stop:2628 length:1518 start_codon:yes stop_codon:yes gene_type:complete